MTVVTVAGQTRAEKIVPKRFVSYLYLAAAMTTVGSTVIVSKIIADTLPVFFATSLRFALSSLIFLAIIILTRQRFPKLTPREWGLLAFQAGAGSVGYSVLMIVGLKTTSATDAGVISGALPAAAALIALVALRERPSRRMTLAIVIATVGVIVVNMQIANTAQLEFGMRLLGNTLVLAAIFAEAIFILLNKRLRTPVPPLIVATCMSCFGFLLTVVPGFFELIADQSILSQRAGLEAVAYYAIVPTVIGFLLWYTGSSRTTGTEAALFTAVLPISAVIMATTFLGETLHLRHIVGSVLVLTAIVVGATPGASKRGPIDS